MGACSSLSPLKLGKEAVSTTDSNNSKSNNDGKSPTDLLPSGNLFESDSGAWKPVHSAIRWNKYEEAKTLLSALGAVECLDPVTMNRPLHIAAQNGHLELVNLLISKGGDVNSLNAKGNTPLHMATGYDYYRVAQALITAGADRSKLNEAGIRADRGLDGDKSMGLIALISVEGSEGVLDALQLCEQGITELEKGNFVASALKIKKQLGADWTSEMHDKFKAIVDQL